MISFLYIFLYLLIGAIIDITFECMGCDFDNAEQLMKELGDCMEATMAITLLWPVLVVLMIVYGLFYYISKLAICIKKEIKKEKENEEQ